MSETPKRKVGKPRALSEEQRAKVRKERAEGVTYTALAKKYRVGNATIFRVVTGCR